jgi:hypothetical protein
VSTIACYDHHTGVRGVQGEEGLHRQGSVTALGHHPRDGATITTIFANGPVVTDATRVASAASATGPGRVTAVARVTTVTTDDLDKG